MLKYIIIAAVFLIGLVVVASTRSNANQFQDLLEYEAQNRAYALLAVEAAVQDTEQGDQKAFWQAYLNLEKLNAKKYGPHLEKHGVSATAGFMTRLRAWASGIALYLAPQSSASIMYGAAKDYVERLKLLETLAPSDKEFFAYVVRQEVAQVDAFRLAKSNDYAGAAASLQQFVDANTAQ